jgi:hypothetical protein
MAVLHVQLYMSIDGKSNYRCCTIYSLWVDGKRVKLAKVNSGKTESLFFKTTLHPYSFVSAQDVTSSFIPHVWKILFFMSVNQADSVSTT